MSIYMYICIYIYMCIYIGMYIRIFIYIYIYTPMYTYVCFCVTKLQIDYNWLAICSMQYIYTYIYQVFGSMYDARFCKHCEHVFHISFVQYVCYLADWASAQSFCFSAIVFATQCKHVQNLLCSLCPNDQTLQVWNVLYQRHMWSWYGNAKLARHPCRSWTASSLEKQYPCHLLWRCAAY